MSDESVHDLILWLESYGISAGVTTAPSGRTVIEAIRKLPDGSSRWVVTAELRREAFERLFEGAS